MKGTIEIQQKGITDLDVDAVVNAANSQLLVKSENAQQEVQ